MVGAAAGGMSCAVWAALSVTGARVSAAFSLACMFNWRVASRSALVGAARAGRAASIRTADSAGRAQG